MSAERNVGETAEKVGIIGAIASVIISGGIDGVAIFFGLLGATGNWLKNRNKEQPAH